MKSDVCDPSRLVAFLDGTLNDREVQEFMQHLDECRSCGEELEKLAATSERWNEAKRHLSRTSTHDRKQRRYDVPSRSLPLAVRQVIDMLDPTDNPNSMGRLGSYEIAGVVGAGAMGLVLKATDRTLDRVVALKVMNPTLAQCGTARYRFAREAKAAAGVLHPNVIAIHSVSTDRDLPFLVMPYIAGNSLQQRMSQRGPLDLAETLRVGSQIAAGLAAAHQKGLIHRDIKPSNVMLDEGVETAVITDFGLARTIDDATMTRSGAITGTPEYMSPEQARGDTVGCASDVFSLGSLLYALCCGKSPFRSKTPFGVLRKITDKEPTPIRELNPKIPVWLCELIERMHSKSPLNRPSSHEVCDLLERCLAHHYQPDRIPLPKELSPNVPGSHFLYTKTFLFGAITMMTLVLSTLVFALTQTGNPVNNGIVAAGSSTVNQESSKDPTVFKTMELQFPKPAEKGTLVVDINQGFIEVTGHDKPGVIIEILTPQKFIKPKRPKPELSQIFSPKYDLDTVGPRNMIKFDAYNQDYVLNLRIKVPRATNLSLDTYMGSHIEVKNVAGVLKSESQHGDIRLLNISGSAIAYSRNGDVEIRFQDVYANAKLDFESYNGDIDLTLPASIGVTTAISSGRGSFLSAFDIESIDKKDCPESILAKVKSNTEEYRFGSINGGGVPLRIESENGVIRLRQPKRNPIGESSFESR